MLIARRMFTVGALLVPALASGQVGQCDGGRGTRVPDLGFADISCNNCTINVSPRRMIYRFGTEPWIEEVTQVGEGRLREGDQLVAVDGRLGALLTATDQFAVVHSPQAERRLRHSPGCQERFDLSQELRLRGHVTRDHHWDCSQCQMGCIPVMQKQ